MGIGCAKNSRTQSTSNPSGALSSSSHLLEHSLLIKNIYLAYSPPWDQPQWSPRAEVWPPPTLLTSEHQEASAGSRWRWFFAFFTFLPLFFNDSQLFFQLNTYHHIMQSAETQPTDWSLASRPHHQHTNNNRHLLVCFDGEFFSSSPFLTLFFNDSQLFFQLSNHGPNTGMVETQPTDWSFASCPHRSHANNNRHHSVCFCSEFLSSSPFLPLF